MFHILWIRTGYWWTIWWNQCLYSSVYHQEWHTHQMLDFGAIFTTVSGLVTDYRIYKSYTFRKNVQHTLSYILYNQRHYQQYILPNKTYLLSLAEITWSNFKDVQTDIAYLKKETNNNFHRYLHKLMHTTADTIFY